MSDLAAAAAALGIPESLAERSAKARAAASGSSEEQVLSAWAAGGSVAAAASEPAPAEEASEAREAEPQEPEPQTSDVPPTPAPQAEPVPIPAAVAVAPAAVPEEDPVVAAPLADRVGVSGRVGAVTGLVAAVLVVLFSSQWLLPRAAVTGEAGAFQTVVEVIGGWVIVGSALIGVAVGLAVAGVSRSVTGMLDRGMRLVSSPVVSMWTGILVGAVGGALVGAIVLGAGTESELDATVTVVPVLAGVIWIVLGWIAVGWATGALVQVVGVPDGVEIHEAEETSSVRHRLVSAWGIPLGAFLVILSVVLPLAFIFIQFPVFAPVLAIVVAGGILGFSGLAASRPGMRITAGEFLIAGAGIGVILLILVSVLLVQGGGEHGEEQGTEQTSESPSPEAGAILHLVHL